MQVFDEPDRPGRPLRGRGVRPPIGAIGGRHRVYDHGYEGAITRLAATRQWHVVINQDQVGPMTAVDVQQRYASGEIDAETSWRASARAARAAPVSA